MMKHLLRIYVKSVGTFWFLVGLLFTSYTFAQSDDVTFQYAREAYKSKNEMALAEDVEHLKTQQYLLAPYADYWLMLLRLSRSDDLAVENIINEYADMPFADSLRAEWLKKLAKQQNWPLFFKQYALSQHQDVSLQCYAMLGHTQLADADLSVQAKALWLTTADLPENCNQLFNLLQKSGVITNDDIWLRFRLALQDEKLSLAKNIILLVPEFENTNLKLLDRAFTSPQQILEKPPVSFKSRFGVELYLYAVDRLARTKLDAAVDIYNKINGFFELENRAFGWGRIAYHAAQSHHQQALSFYRLAEGINLNKDQLAWKVRAGLRSKDWTTVLKGIAAMTQKQMDESVWRYWKARALKEQGKLVEANALFNQLSRERHYYGWLATDELESIMSNPELDYTVSEDEVTAIAANPSIKRAVEFQRLEMHWEAKLEWAWATQEFSDKQLIAAAEFAIRQNWYDIAIITADNTKQIHDFNLRFPTPYRELIQRSAKKEKIDEAWVYGLTRQESRFMHYAKSGVGASGLMQLMPATAKWAAKRMGNFSYTSEMIHDLSTNIDIGTYYMHHILDAMGGQTVLATAAYNAGPTRAKRWMASTPLEASIYIETIPYAETRNYVQKVMANSNFYAPRLGSKIETLKERLGIIPANGEPELLQVDSQ